MKNVCTLALVACVASYSLNAQAMVSRALLARLQASQTLTRLTNARSFSQSAYTHNQHHEQSHQGQRETVYSSKKYKSMLVSAGILTVGAASYVAYNQHKNNNGYNNQDSTNDNNNELKQLYLKYNVHNQQDMLALAEAHSLISWLSLKERPKYTIHEIAIDKDFADKLYAEERINYLYRTNVAARHYFIDYAAQHIEDFSHLFIYEFIDIPAAGLKLLKATIEKIHKLESTFDTLKSTNLKAHFEHIQALRKTGDTIAFHLALCSGIEEISNWDADILNYMAHHNNRFRVRLKEIKRTAPEKFAIIEQKLLQPLSSENC